MDSVIEFLQHVREFLNPKFLIDWMLALLGNYVYLGLWFVIFAETGLAVGFFLPGDSLLVVSGLFAAANKLNVWLVMLAFFLGSVIGDSTGYWTGRVMGKTLFNRESSFIFKPSRVEKAKHFFEKYGVKTVILARFVPIVRTFASFVAGAAQMTSGAFVFYNAAGAAGWVILCLGAGLLFGNVPIVKENFSLVTIGIVVVSLLPMLVEYLLSRSK